MKEQYGEEFFTAVKASCSLPFVSPMVKFQGMRLLDGGIADPIPIQKSIDDGNKKHVIIMTRNQCQHQNHLIDSGGWRKRCTHGIRN